MLNTLDLRTYFGPSRGCLILSVLNRCGSTPFIVSFKLCLHGVFFQQILSFFHCSNDKTPFFVFPWHWQDLHVVGGLSIAWLMTKIPAPFFSASIPIVCWWNPYFLTPESATTKLKHTTKHCKTSSRTLNVSGDGIILLVVYSLVDYYTSHN